MYAPWASLEIDMLRFINIVIIIFIINEIKTPFTVSKKAGPGRAEPRPGLAL